MNDVPMGSQRIEDQKPRPSIEDEEVSYLSSMEYLLSTYCIPGTFSGLILDPTTNSPVHQDSDVL